MKRWLLIDYDDTLGGVLVDGKVCTNDAAYVEVRRQFTSTMGVFGFPASEANELVKEVDQALCKQFGFADRDRFAHALVRTYKALATRHDKEIIPSMVESIERLGDRVFQYRYMPLPGALETLHALQEAYHLAIVTKGDSKEQCRKIKDSGVAHFADAIFPLGFKNKEDWLEVITSLHIPEEEYKDVWAIGNAPKSDINVPLTLGMNAIHVNQGGWVFEQEDYVEPLEGRQLIVVDTITEILQHLQWS